MRALVATAALVAFAAVASSQSVPLVLQNYKPVTTERLKKPDAGDWLIVRRTYDGWGYSPLEQITRGNVKRLQPVWIVFDRRDQRPRGAADRERRRHVRGDAGQSGHRARRGDRQPALALQRPIPEDIDRAARDESRRGALRRQGVLRRRAKRCWLRSTPRPAKRSGPRRWQKTRTATTCRWHRSS